MSENKNEEKEYDVTFVVRVSAINSMWAGIKAIEIIMEEADRCVQAVTEMK